MRKRFVLFLSPRQARWLYHLLALFPMATARAMRQNLGQLLAQPPAAAADETLPGKPNGTTPPWPRRNGYK